jgi:predicted DNA-binding ribbon-helix-helix protein
LGGGDGDESLTEHRFRMTRDRGHRGLSRSEGGSASPKERTSAKRSIVVDRRKTSVTVEDAFWDALRLIAIERGDSLSDLVTVIHADRRDGNLSSAIRLFVLRYYVDQINNAAKLCR